jgi:hypothetical protein
MSTFSTTNNNSSNNSVLDNGQLNLIITDDRREHARMAQALSIEHLLWNLEEAIEAINHFTTHVRSKAQSDPDLRLPNIGDGKTYRKVLAEQVVQDILDLKQLRDNLDNTILRQERLIEKWDEDIGRFRRKKREDGDGWGTSNGWGSN